MVSFLLIGPVPFLPISPSLSLTVCSLIVQGVGSAAVLVSSYSCVLRSALQIPGYGEDLATFSIISGLWTAAFALGNCLGPSVAGVLYDQVGFRWGTVSVQVLTCLMATFNIWAGWRDARVRLFNNKVYQELAHEMVI